MTVTVKGDAGEVHFEELQEARYQYWSSASWAGLNIERT